MDPQISTITALAAKAMLYRANVFSVRLHNAAPAPAAASNMPFAKPAPARKPIRVFICVVCEVARLKIISELSANNTKVRQLYLPPSTEKQNAPHAVAMSCNDAIAPNSSGLGLP